jgi:hypothetical protein
MTKLDKSRGQQSGGSRSAGRVRRFPYLLSIGVTAEIMQGLEAGTHNGLFSISDSAPLALVHGLMASGHFPPRLNNQPQLQNGGNGHGPVGSSFSHRCGSNCKTGVTDMARSDHLLAIAAAPAAAQAISTIRDDVSDVEQSLRQSLESGDTATAAVEMRRLADLASQAQVLGICSHPLFVSG